MRFFLNGHKFKTDIQTLKIQFDDILMLKLRHFADVSDFGLYILFNSGRLFSMKIYFLNCHNFLTKIASTIFGLELGI